MADSNKNVTLKSLNNPLLTGAALSYPFENIATSALMLPQPQAELTTTLANDGEVDNFLGHDDLPKSTSFSAVIKRPSSHSLQQSPSFSPTPGSVPPSNLSPNYPAYYNPLISGPICTPVVTTYSSSSTANTFSDVPFSNLVTAAPYSQFSSIFSNPSGDSNLDLSSKNQNNFPVDSLPTFKTFDSNQPSALSGYPPTSTETNKLGSVYQTFSAPEVLTSSISQPVSATPIETSSIFQPVSAPPIGSSSIFQPVSNPSLIGLSPVPLQTSSFSGENSFNPVHKPPSPFYQPAIQTSKDPTSATAFHPVQSLSSPSNSPANQSVISAINNLKLNSSSQLPTSVFQPSSVHNTDNQTITNPVPTYLPNLYQSGNVLSPPLFSSSTPSEGHSLISSLPPAVSAPVLPKGGNLLNTYRLGPNLKRPAYAPPPDLSVSATSNMAAIPDPVIPSAPNPATLFTPICDEVDNRTDNTNLGLANQSSSSDSSSSLQNSSLSNTATDFSLNPTLPSYQSPVSTQAMPATVLPPTDVPQLPQGQMYRPPYHHWFFKKQIEGKVIWMPFSMADSLKLEEAFTSPDISPDTLVPTDGGRYDVDVLRRQRLSVYWQEEPGEVRRCSWFVKGSLDSRYTPYEEKIATMLEEEYKTASISNEWNRQVPLADGEVIILHSPHAIAHHLRSSSPDAWGNSPQMQQKPRVVKRGLDEFDIPEGEPETVDHILFLVHGIGKFCDLKFRPVTEVVDDFRSVSLQLLQSHFRGGSEMGTVNRVEVLPVSWHTALHTEEIDRKLRNITLGSIHRLRQFTNDTLLDILFYTSPVFCETIVQAVGNELNRLYSLFKTRNPHFKGGVSLGGHSLGSLILFDMLCNQKIHTPNQNSVGSDLKQTQESSDENKIDSNDNDNQVKTSESENTPGLKHRPHLNKGLSYVAIGNAGTGQPFISYPQLNFHPNAFFALGSPIGMFVTVRGIDALGENFRLPTCSAFFNIFHPFDPVAYRVETLISPDLINVQPVLIPHHKGRKRMHLELKDTMAHVGAAIKQRLVESIQSTWNTVYQLAMFHKTEDIGEEVNKVLDDQLMRQQSNDGAGSSQEVDNSEAVNLELKVGLLNGGRRIDYVLQEAPLESFNEYIFALSSHVCYWESEDTMLMILKEIYATMGIAPDNQVPQQILPFEINDNVDGLPCDHPPQYVPLTAPQQPTGMDPTAPPSDAISVGPPPISGFRRN